MREIICLILFLSAVPLIGQVTFQPKKPMTASQKGIVYEKEHTGNLRFHTQGFAFGYNFGKLQSYDVSEYYSVEIGYIKDPREYKQRFRATNASIIGRPVIYGKINNLLTVKGLYKKKKYLSEKAEKSGIAVGYSYAFGLTAGILKPYYITIVKYDAPWNLDFKSIKYEESTAEQFLNYNTINGADSYFKGFGESKIIPGLSGEISVVFDIGAFDAFARSLEVGVMADVFSRQIPLMVATPASSYFINAFLNVSLGQRW